MREIILKVNGEEHTLRVSPHETLAHVLREKLYLTGVKVGCEKGDCGACTVLMDGRSVVSCILPVMKAEGKEITTIEGLVAEDGQLHPLQDGFIRHGAIQCGFCTSGMILEAKAFLDKKSNPTEQDVRESLTGHICRCTGYQQIVDAIMDEASSSRKRG
jgi:carbon-monoxide dehydrogenase small subunit